MAGLISPPISSSSAAHPSSDSPPKNQQAFVPACSYRELISVAIFVALADVTIYRSAGFTGLAAFFIAAPVLIFVSQKRRGFARSAWLLALMLLCLAARLLWQGNAFAIAISAVILIAFSLALLGYPPYIVTVLAGAAQLVAAGAIRAAQSVRVINAIKRRLSFQSWLNLLLPVAAVGLFGAIFIRANPDLVKQVEEGWDRFAEWLAQRIEEIGDYWPEFLFCVGAAYIGIGLLRPLIAARMPHSAAAQSPTAAAATRESPGYYALRNTLFAVIGLFALYLVFEFATLWFRTFPPGFYYAGYAHEGAAWLTVALALATLMLSVIFRGETLQDPRLPILRKLAWIWSAENLVLALTVYNRLFIYIDFNGMTRMRTVGLFGMTTVVAGFLLVIWKIAYGRDFAWLINRQLWALAIAIYLFVLTPVDFVVHQYNVRQILNGHLAPAVQISVHPISSEGVLALTPLVECSDPILRNGFRALLAQRQIDLERHVGEQAKLGWSAFQLADYRLIKQLRANDAAWSEFSDSQWRQDALNEFHRYAYQWY